MAIKTTDRQSVLAGISEADSAARKLYSDAAEKMKTGLAALLGGNPSASTAKIRGYGDQVAGLGGKIDPLVADVKSLGGELAGIGRGMNDQGVSLLGLGNDILNMNRGSSSPLVKALLGIFDSYSPDRLASLAGQDVANSFDTAEGQQKRNLARSGVNPSSGRYSALGQQLITALATAKAAAKTRASMLGIDKQSDFINSVIGALGRQIVGQGVSTQAQGASILGNAIGADQTAAGMLAQMASLFSSAASLEGTAANMDLGFAKDVMGQENAMAQLDTATANYYGNLFSELLSYDENQMRGVQWGGVNVTPAPDKSDPWNEVTGHGETWWKNQATGRSGQARYDDAANRVAEVLANR